MPDSLTHHEPQHTLLHEESDSLRPVVKVYRDEGPILVMEPADSATQAYFGGKPAVLREFETHFPQLATPEFPLPHDSIFLAKFRELWDPASREITWRHETVPYRPEGYAGDPVPYQFRTDDYVTSALMISFFLMVWVVASSWHFLRGLLRDFFYNRQQPNLFTERAGALRGRFFLVMQTCFLQSLLFFDYTQEQMPEVFAQVSPYTLLLTSTGVISTFYFGKILTYRFINGIFFPPERNKQWNNHFLVSILATGFLLLPLTLLVVFFDLPFEETLIAYVLLIAIVKILLFYKCYRIFFGSLLGNLHIILYFCALEIVPSLFIWGLLLSINHSLVVLA